MATFLRLLVREGSGLEGVGRGRHESSTELVARERQGEGREGGATEQNVRDHGRDRIVNTGEERGNKCSQRVTWEDSP